MATLEDLLIDLQDQLENTTADAAQAIQELIEDVRLAPEKGILKFELFGQLAAFTSLADKKTASRKRGR